MDQPIRYEARDGVAEITMDDGKLNVMSLPMLEALHAAFDRAAGEGAITVLKSGREGIFTAGFDLKVFAANDPVASSAMVRAGAELALKVFSHPAPVITVCAGHAYPMGAFLILASDVRIGVLGPYRIGFNEVAIGIPVPSFALELGRRRLAPAWLDRTAVTGEMFGMEAAAQAGFFDRLEAPAAVDAALEATIAGARKIHRPSQIIVKERLRGPAIAMMRTAIEEEITSSAYAARNGGGPTIRLPTAEPASI
ncbi:crotonase/enoyl-CoA hydratase family protein [Phenylobacterium sp.]|jgi:enoyl-CoA hydratase|uniref:crotonase/enoyl-CoA hydratase family protein n=1 Tax=Phenylobacterium sp. TaxID=1871053 RepID=UPI002E34B82F|nr:crotonase/enoyl-CoA hydratase family protein [Phenylobacterium sp.]HEX2561418.1 crotonase/enoyl-CoA hydratase family protein [Phenylobacterium sp.]